MKINENYLKLKQNYLFATVSEKVAKFKATHPNSSVINMGIGDVTQPLCEEVVLELKSAANQMQNQKTFKGYGPYEGYEFLRETIANQFKKRGVNLKTSEIFINDGAKSDCANILNIFSSGQTALIVDPTYPAYVDTNIMAGNNIIFANATKENNFLPLPNKKIDADLIYICSPNNPTGATFSRADLAVWVEYALEKDAIILFDSAYNAFIEDDSLPRSIFEIENAKFCAIEICSFSKTAGFTGLRCGFTIVPENLKRGQTSLNKLWMRHQASNFNGVSYVVQCAAAATFSEKGSDQIKNTLKIYKNNAKIMSQTLSELGVFFTGGINSPYIWFECFDGTKSWDFFDILLEKLQIVGTPGVGFGQNGEHFFRLTAFSTEENTKKAMNLLTQLKN